MVENSNRQGAEGEEIAKQHLQLNGYVIRERNWRFRRYEVDIIAQTGDVLVFVEVKTRASEVFGAPELAVTRQKQRFLIAAAQEYIRVHELSMEARFDIIAILRDNNSHTVKHLPGAFYPLVK